MPLNLIVIPPKGEEYRANEEPLPNGRAAGAMALRALRNHGISSRIAGMQFANMVATADRGAVVTHESGYSFRTEEDK